MTLGDQPAHHYSLNACYVPTPVQVGCSGRGKFPPLKIPTVGVIWFVASIKLCNSPGWIRVWGSGSLWRGRWPLQPAPPRSSEFSPSNLKQRPCSLSPHLLMVEPFTCLKHVGVLRTQTAEQRGREYPSWPSTVGQALGRGLNTLCPFILDSVLYWLRDWSFKESGEDWVLECLLRAPQDCIASLHSLCTSTGIPTTPSITSGPRHFSLSILDSMDFGEHFQHLRQFY